MKFFRRKTAVAITASLIISVASCTKVHHGYKIEEEMTPTLQQMVNQKANINQIIAAFGSPTFVNTPINDTICYVDAEGQQVAFNRFYKPTYRFLCVVFENQIAKTLQSKTLAKIEKAKMTKYDTKFHKPL